MRLLDLYLAGCLSTMIIMVVITVRAQKSHGMRLPAIFQLTASAAVTWPLLAFAALQCLAFFALAKGLSALRARSSRAAQTAVNPAPAELAAAS
jgi:hypothetical protein